MTFLVYEELGTPQVYKVYVHVQVCEILLENGADVDHADKEGKTALFAAASMGHLEILNILLFWGCYVDGIGRLTYTRYGTVPTYLPVR